MNEIIRMNSRSAEIQTSIRYELPEHDVLLSFLGDSGAEEFITWWEDEGKHLFEIWVEDPRKYEE